MVIAPRRSTLARPSGDEARRATIETAFVLEARVEEAD